MFTIPQMRGRRLSTAVAMLALFGLGTCGLALTGDAAADTQSGISTHRVIYTAVSDDTVIAAILADEGVGLKTGNRCPVSRLRVSYDDPGPGWPGGGAFIPPLGPHSGTTRRVNGVVRCHRSHYAFVGFQATLTKGEWTVVTVPDPEGGEHGEAGGEHPGLNIPDDLPIPPPVSGPIASGGYRGPDIEGYARYEGQKYCHPAAKPGTTALRNLLLSHYPTTTSMGISRPCDMGGRSEHKEGRGFDWGTDVDDPSDLAAVQDFFRTIFATDRHGNPHALVRRMGLMYAIWDGHIWTSYAQEWQPYSGTSPHTDHVHISLSWAGALGMTSYWSNEVTDGTFAPPREVREAPWIPNSLTIDPSTLETPAPRSTPKPAASISPSDDPAPSPEATPRRTRRDRRRDSTPAPSPTATPLPPTPSPVDGNQTPRPTATH
jgi:hypothetical protein